MLHCDLYTFTANFDFKFVASWARFELPKKGKKYSSESDQFMVKIQLIRYRWNNIFQHTYWCNTYICVKALAFESVPEETNNWIIHEHANMCLSVPEREQKLCAYTAIDLKGQLFENVYLLSLISLPSMPVSHCISEKKPLQKRVCFHLVPRKNSALDSLNSLVILHSWRRI